MRGARPLLGIISAVALIFATAVPVAAEEPPAQGTITIDVTVSHYLGGDWDHAVSFLVSCNGYEETEVWGELPGRITDIGPFDVGTSCQIDVGYINQGDEQANFELPPTFTPAQQLAISAGSNEIGVNFTRLWGLEWPPEADEQSWHDIQVVPTRVRLNGNGGITVEGLSWCPDAAEILTGDLAGDVYANAQWTAVQYVGRRTAISASYESAVAHLCWEGSRPAHGPYAWQTRYPNGAIQYVYALNGKFGSGTIHVEATSGAEVVLVTQNFAPEGIDLEGTFVPYLADCVDNNGDGWCVADHVWMGWGQADLRPVKSR